MSTPAPAALATTSESEHAADRGGALSFTVVAVIFGTLLALGVGLGVVIHRSYVGFDRVAAHHVPPDTTLVLRWDIEKVSLFEPTRHFLLPLLDERPGTHGSPVARAAPGVPAHGAKSRREHFADESGSMIARDLREVVALWGPGEGDWAVVLAGSFPKGDLVLAVERTLVKEGWPWRPLGQGAAFGRAPDGAFVIASSTERLDTVLVDRPPVPEIPRVGAGALRLGPGRGGLPGEAAGLLGTLGTLSRVQGEVRWGNPLPVEVDLHYAGPRPADAPARIRRVLRALLGEDLARIEQQLAPLKVQPAGNEAVVVQLLLDDVALERAANRVAERVERALGHGPAPE